MCVCVCVFPWKTWNTREITIRHRKLRPRPDDDDNDDDGGGGVVSLISLAIA